MGNQVSLGPSELRGKVILWDGSVQEIEQSVTVAELMLEHPEQVVVELHSAVSQKRPTALPADKKLERKKVYLMVPVKRGKPVGLSGEEGRRLLLLLNSALHSKSLVSSSKFLPWLTRFCQNTRIVEPQPKDDETDKREDTSHFSELLPDTPHYLNRQFSAKGWKPTLDTIKEKNIDPKITHWFFLKSSF